MKSYLCVSEEITGLLAAARLDVFLVGDGGRGDRRVDTSSSIGHGLNNSCSTRKSVDLDREILK